MRSNRELEHPHLHSQGEDALANNFGVNSDRGHRRPSHLTTGLDASVSHTDKPRVHLLRSFLPARRR